MGNKNIVSVKFTGKDDTVEFYCEGKVMTQAIIKYIKDMDKMKAMFLF
ncbi:hypothetical protein J4052_06175 [Bacillus toyonensis]|nr:hypothetical protein [Bacillus toyonensis]